MARFRRKALGIALLALSGFLLWYSVSTYILSGQNRLGNFSARFFPEARILDGHSDYLAHDSAGAAQSYGQAILAGPSFIDAWMGLARARIAEGRTDEARRILDIIAPTLASVGTWKWQELLFASDLRDEPYFTRCYNYILSYIPHRRQEAGLLAARFWGGWVEIIPHVVFTNRPAFLGTLMEVGQVDAAVALFGIIEKEGPMLQQNDRLRLCDFFISNDRLKEAKTAWHLWKNDDSLIDDGRFEAPPLNKAFGWRFGDDPDFVLERATNSPEPGISSLHVYFKGTGNVHTDLLLQIVPVDPGNTYTLSFSRQSSGLTTDRGVFLKVDTMNNDILAQSEPVTGNSPWKKKNSNLQPHPDVKRSCCVFGETKAS